MEHRQKRIEYLDALRGFTMLLVVVNHIHSYTLGYSTAELAGSVNYYFSLFRMPLFFFVSGFVLYKHDVVWDRVTSLGFLKKKFTVQILSPAIFYLIYMAVYDIDIVDSLLSVNKSGYWFTFALFEYFILYITIQWAARRIGITGRSHDIFMLLCAVAIIAFPYTEHLFKLLDTEGGFSYSGLSSDIFAATGIDHFKHFMFFILGVLTRKHFAEFERQLDRHWPLIVSALFFALVNIAIPDIYTQNKVTQLLFKLPLGMCGIIITFALFRKSGTFFTKERRLGKVMQFVGKRTLDIYLLHYFFMPTGVEEWMSTICNREIPFWDFGIAIVLALAVMIVCLATSSMLRLHPGLATFLFGARKKNQELQQ